MREALKEFHGSSLPQGRRRIVDRQVTPPRIRSRAPGSPPSVQLADQGATTQGSLVVRLPRRPGEPDPSRGMPRAATALRARSLIEEVAEAPVPEPVGLELAGVGLCLTGVLLATAIGTLA